MATPHHEITDELLELFNEHRTSDRAIHEKAYLKSQLTHLGVTVPNIRACVKQLHKRYPALSRTALLALVRHLWASEQQDQPVHELRFAAVLWLTHFRKKLTLKDVPLLERLLGASKTWALLDPLAIEVAGHLAATDPAMAAVLDRWSQHGDFWLRRSAMLALLKPLRKGEGDFERFGRYADGMLHEKEFFVRKAIGWVLRERSKKCPDEVYAWVLPRAGRMSGLSFREATRKLPAQQQELLAKARG